jgi:hypothetical protein
VKKVHQHQQEEVEFRVESEKRFLGMGEEAVVEEKEKDRKWELKLVQMMEQGVEEVAVLE